MVWNAIAAEDIRENIQPTRERAPPSSSGVLITASSPWRFARTDPPHADEAAAGIPNHGLVIHVAASVSRSTRPRARSGARSSRSAPQPVAMAPLLVRMGAQVGPSDYQPVVIAPLV